MKTQKKQKDLEIKVTNYIHALGVPANIKGYIYIRKAIMLAVEDMDILNYVTKRLYPLVAKEYNTTSSKVERAIRHAIEVAFTKNRTELANNLFSSTINDKKCKPTNSQFIALIADQLNLGLNID